MDNDLFIELYSDPRFEKLIRKIMEQRPQIPAHNPRADNTEEWKAASATQAGFDIWVAYLKVPEELKNVRRTSTAE